MDLDPELLKLLRCPASGLPLHVDGDFLTTADGQNRYDVVAGIPCLMRAADATHAGYRDLLVDNARAKNITPDIDAFLEGMLVPTCGNLFHGVKLSGDYPIPDLPDQLPKGLVVDVGCNWGRWSIAGGLSGRTMVGVDIHLQSLLVARELSRRLTPNNRPHFVLADARYLPFAADTFDGAFSYSVIQHFSRPVARQILTEVGRVLSDGAVSVIQMPNSAGLKSRLSLARRKDKEGEEFDVRFYSIPELENIFGQAIGDTTWSVDCFFGLNVHARDRRLVPRTKRWIIDTATAVKRLATVVPGLSRLSDSVFLTSSKAKGSTLPAKG